MRYARGCHPDDLWTSYFTSSVYVEEQRWLYGEPDVIKVRKTFQTDILARKWEEKVLRRVSAVKNSRWLNKGNSGLKFYRVGPLSHKTKQKLSCRFSEERRKEYQLRMSGESNPMFGKPNQHFLGHSHSKETKILMSQSHKGKKKSDRMRKRIQFYATHLRPKKVCPYCNKEIPIHLFGRWHNLNCKEFTGVKI